MGTYFRPDPNQKEKKFVFPLTFQGKSYSWQSSSGVFHQKGLDEGSRLLLEATETIPGSRILDLGCGHGPIGLLALEQRPQASALLVDINERACRSARKNLLQLKSRAWVLRTDGAQGLKKGAFDFVLTNPPIRTGLPTLKRLFAEAGQALASDGILAFVCRPKQGGRRLATIAGEILGADPKKIARNKGFEIFVLDRSV